MTPTETISQRHPDGAIDVWLDGWHIRFPPADARPTVERAMSGSSGSDSAGLTAVPFASGRAVRHGSWIVAVTASDFTVIPTEPEQNDDDHRYHYYRM